MKGLYRKKLIIACLVFIIGIFIFPNNVFAKNRTSGSKACQDFIDIDIKPKSFENIRSGEFTVTFTSIKGKWNVYAAGVEGISDIFSKNGGLKLKKTTLLEEGKSESIKTKVLSKSNGNSYGYIVVYAVLAEEFKYTTGAYNSTTEETCHPATMKLVNANDQEDSIDASQIKFKRTDNNKDGGTGKLRYKKISTKVIKSTVSGKKACKKMVQGTYCKNTSNYDKCMARMQDEYPYCWGGETGVEFSNTSITKIGKKFSAYFEAVAQFLNAASKYSTDRDAYKNLKQGTPTDTTNLAITCDNKNVNTQEETYWHEEEKLSNTYCTVKCIEKLTVTYSPPQAVKAGLCFQYQVTVKSTSECGMELTNEGKKLTLDSLPGMGLPNTREFPVCENDDAIGIECDDNTDSGGPDEEFDSCINKCDGGKYSQKCINKCYKSTYENSTKKTASSKTNANTKKLSFNFKSNVNVQLLANDDDEKEGDYDTYYYGGDDDDDENVKSFNLKNCNKLSYFEAHKKMCAKGYMEAKGNKPYGKYTKDKNGKLIWKSTAKAKTNEAAKSCGYPGKSDGNGWQLPKVPTNPNDECSITGQIKRASPYYLATVNDTIELIYNLFGYDWSSGTKKEFRHGNNYYNPSKWYIIDNDGFLRQNGSENWHCRDDCWHTGSISKSSCSKVSEKDALDEILEPLDGADAKLKECTAAVTEKCKTSTVTYTIGADGKNTTYYTDQNTSSSSNEKIERGCKGKGMAVFDNSTTEGTNKDYKCIFAGLDDKDKSDGDGQNGICYGINENGHKYKTTITFPQAYIDNKTGDEKLTNADVDRCFKENTCTVKDYYYCTANGQTKVNEDWFNWYYYNNQSGTAPEPIVYNINAKIGANVTTTYSYNQTTKSGGFGMLGWSINFKCFYAVNNSQGKKKCNDECCDDQCPTTNNVNYSIRMVDPSNIFNNGTTSDSNSSSSGTVTTKKRQIGYNWTSDAQIKYDDTDLKKRGYTVDPEKRLEEIQNNANHTYDDSNVDLEVNLSSEDMVVLKGMANDRNTTIGNWGEQIGSGSNQCKSSYEEPVGDEKTLSVYRSCILDKFNVNNSRYQRGYNS